jgi:hypothetical protein
LKGKLIHSFMHAERTKTTALAMARRVMLVASCGLQSSMYTFLV